MAASGPLRGSRTRARNRLSLGISAVLTCVSASSACVERCDAPAISAFTARRLSASNTFPAAPLQSCSAKYARAKGHRTREGERVVTVLELPPGKKPAVSGQGGDCHGSENQPVNLVNNGSDAISMGYEANVLHGNCFPLPSELKYHSDTPA